MNNGTASNINSQPIKKMDFSDLIQTTINPNPTLRNYDWMVLGPFVLETDGAFETEYLYEREKILNEDYLESSGGETNILPYLGKECKNDYYGKDILMWEEGINKWDTLRFEGEDSDTVDAMYQTEQRNCVYYAAFYIECQEESEAIICYESSGSRLYVNGILVHESPYGRVKGLPTMGNQVAVIFHKGLNLVMFKVRTGYICDTVDLSISNCTIYPCIARSGNAGIVSPTKTGVFVGTVEKPRQIFPTFIGAFGGNVQGGSITLEAEDHKEHYEISHLRQGEVELIRLSVPLDQDSKEATIRLEIEEKGYKPFSTEHRVELMEFNGFVGEEHIYSDFHFDTTYHQEQRVYALGAIHILRNVVEYLKRDPSFKAIISEIDYLHPYYSIYPEHRDILKAAFLEGRAESDCFYNQPNEMTSSPEGLVRNLVYGQLYQRDVMGRICDIYSPGDVFGHPNQLSQICAKGLCSGVAWNKYIFGLDPVFRHVSPDGTSLIHNRGRLSRDDAKQYDIGVCHNSGDAVFTVPAYPRDGNTKWMDKTVPSAIFSVPSAFHKGLRDGEKKLVRSNGNSPFSLTSRDISLYHAGVALTRMDLKQANRLGENLLITAEKFALVASLYGAKYPEKALDKAWRQILCGQHHDSITGTNNEISFVDLMIQYREAVELGIEMINRSTGLIASAIDTQGYGRPFVVFNSHTWARKEPCIIEFRLEKPLENFCMVDSKGNILELQTIYQHRDGGAYIIQGVFTPQVPAMGYSTYYLIEKESQLVQRANEAAIENEFYRILVDPNKGGGIISIYDKVEKRELIEPGNYGPANQVVALKQIHERMETQHEFYTTGHKLYSKDSEAKIISEKGKVFEKIIIKTKMGTVAEIRQEIILYHHVKRIDFNTEIIDYQGADDLFTIIFPTNLKGARPIFDDRFAPQVRSQSRKTLEFQTHQCFMFSHCQVYAANQWMDYGPTVKAVVKKDGVEIASINLGMTALIRPSKQEIVDIGDALLIALTKKALPITPYSDSQQSPFGSRLIHFNEDLLNTDTRIVLSIDGVKNQYEAKILELAGRENVRIFERWLKESGYACMYLRDDDNEWKKPIDVLLIKGTTLDRLRSVVSKIERTLTGTHSFEIPNCILVSNPGIVDDYGISILNTGNIASSVEKDGILNLMLFQTAKFYGNNGKVTGDEELVPEQKTHRFIYSLYPHSGTYREGEVYRKGLEINDPLFAKGDINRNESAFLPEVHSFIESDDNIIITAIKAGGYPMASMKIDRKSIWERGMVVRYFEPHGRENIGQIKFNFDIEGATRVNLLEEGTGNMVINKNNIKLPVTPHTIETLKFALKPIETKLEKVVLGPERELVEPTYIRSWEHDLGSMPMGYLAVTGAISRKPSLIDDTTLELSISMANNRPDMWAEGEMKLVIPEGWEANKEVIPYKVPPQGCEKFNIKVTKPHKNSKGIIRLRYKDDGQEFEDVYEMGYFNPEIKLLLDGNRLKAIVSNNTTEKLVGELSIATPIEMWGNKGYNPLALCSVDPRTIKVAIKPEEVIEYDFCINECFDDSFIAFWAAVKLMVNGRIFFAYTSRQGERKNIWASELMESIHITHGSILPYLKR